MSSFDVLAIVKELQSVVGARVGKIYQVSPHELKIQLNIKNFGNAFLVVEAGKRIHLTEYPKPSPTKPSNFAMSLRKHISGGIIKKIRQINFDRVVELEIEKKSEKYYLICELFGKGNIILTDKNYHILSVMIPKKYKHRELLIRSKYEYPPQKVNPLEVDEKQLKEILKKSTGDIVRTLAVLLGLGGTYAEEVCLRAKIEKNKKELDKEEIKKIIDAIKEINSEIGTKNLIIFDDENAVDATPIFLELYKNKKFLEFDSFNRALDEYYTKYELKKIQEVEKKEFERKIKKIKERLKIQAKTYREFKRKSEKNKKIGDIIYMNFDKFEKLLKTINELRKKFSLEDIAKKIKQKNIRILPNEGRVVVNVQGEEIKLDLKKSASENAEYYYNRGKKFKEKLKGVKISISESVKELKKLKEEGITEKKTKPKKISRKKRKWYEKFRWFFSSDGFLVIGGRDATQNEILVKKHMENEDIFVHADIHGAPVVIIKTSGREIPEKTIKEALDFAVAYSKAWKYGLSGIEAYWVRPDQVSKSPKHGEYLSKGGFVIRGRKNWGVGKTEIAIGFVINDEKTSIIGGPTTAIEQKTPYFVVLVPGRKKSRELAEEIKKTILKKLNEKDKRKVENIEIEEIQRFLPAGGGEIKKN